MISQLWQNFFAKGVYSVQEDENGIVALYKPCDILSMPNKEGICQNALFRLPYHFEKKCYEMPNGRRFFLLNRLDAPTSGLLLGCFDPKLAVVVRECFRQKKVIKRYRALVKAKNIPKKGIFRDPLNETNAGNRLRVRIKKNSPETQLAETKYEVTEQKIVENQRLTILDLQPITGRTHQLRVQCAQRDFPIVGDKTYGDFVLNRLLWKSLPKKRLYLQSYAIAFSYNFQGKDFDFYAQIPFEF